MLELHIVTYLMKREANVQVERGRVVGFPIAWMIDELNIPRGTFYRAVKVAIDAKAIVRTQRGFYALSNNFREICNLIPVVNKPKQGAWNE